MKKFTLIVITILCIIHKCKCQQNGAVIYRFMHLRDTVSTNFYEEDMILYFSAEKTVYRSYTAIKQDSALQAMLIKEFNTGNSVNLGQIKATTKQNYYREIKSERTFVEASLGKDIFIFEDNITPIKWQLLNIEKSIGGFKCKAAQTRYLGRLYTAWYTPNIPINGGPWKLYGLPGLILEAVDEKKHILFQFQGYISNNISIEKLQYAKMAIRTNRIDFMKTLEVIRTNPQLANNGLPITVTRSGTKQNSPMINNPIELD